ncbi:MAG: 6-chlorohydroxyquinol-1,2-dioxygenase [Rhizobiaceae bacterium]|nr:6-chlorohydroxyquinol-1,2-dioxygenase [Rhizobiaceae bacterium]
MTSVLVQELQEQNSTDVVARRLADSPEPELAHALVTIVRLAHQAVRELRPSVQQWRTAIEFLTEVGHASDDRRQEWVLLSDLLGVTQLVEEINAYRPKGTTPKTARGPFYRPDAPRLPLGADICLDGRGERLTVAGHVRDLDGKPVPGAMIETWQANGQGQYENQQPDLQPEFNLRGQFRADEQGNFTYRTVRPAGYRVPDDGPAGELLKGLGYPLHRPAHIHFIISAPGFETIMTHVYDRSDPYLNEDPLFGVKPELLADFRRSPDGGACWNLDFTFVMARARKGTA